MMTINNQQNIISSNITQFLQEFSDYNITALTGDASVRKYYRILVDHQSYLLMDSSKDIDSLRKFINTSAVFSQKVNTPTIYKKDIKKGLLLLQDFGNIQFADLIIHQNIKNMAYHSAIDTLHKIQSININAIDNNIIDNYSDIDYQNELNLFYDWLLDYINSPMSDAQKNIWQDFCKILIGLIQDQKKVLVHRDYHSRNLMLDQSGKVDIPLIERIKLGVIDFQDAKIGAYTYDLVSLLRDAYINDGDDFVKYFAKIYYNHSSTNTFTNNNFNQFWLDLNIMGIQRHLKVLGVFVRLSVRDNKDIYLKHMLKQYNDLLIETNHCIKSNMLDNQQAKTFMQFLDYLYSLDDKMVQHFNTLNH